MKPIPKAYTNTIASRNLVGTRDGNECRCLLEIGEPIHDVTTGHGIDWRCPVRVSVNGEMKILQNACGVDSYQALFLAINSLSLILIRQVAEELDSLRFHDSPIDVRNLTNIAQQGAEGDALTGSA